MARETRSAAIGRVQGSADDQAGINELFGLLAAAQNFDGSGWSMPLGLGIADSVADSGATAAAPAANTTIATVTVGGAGVYRIELSTFQAGTPDANRVNAELRNGSTTVTDLVSVSTDSRMVLRITCAAGAVVLLRTGATVGGAGAVYCGSLVATRVE